jgi:hypothetical protein
LVLARRRVVKELGARRSAWRADRIFHRSIEREDDYGEEGQEESEQEEGGAGTQEEENNESRAEESGEENGEEGRAEAQGASQEGASQEGAGSDARARADTILAVSYGVGHGFGSWRRRR